MTRVQEPDANAYDVLGVPSDASAKAIDDAFHRLIDGGGYRIGVPLRGQWLRAHQIKEAYATLGDPIKRRAYDESLTGASERPLWPASPDNDPGLAALLRLPDDEQSVAQLPPKSTKRAPRPRGGKQKRAPRKVIGSGKDEIDPHVEQKAALAGAGEPELAPAQATEPAEEATVPDVDQHAASPAEGAIVPVVDEHADSPAEEAIVPVVDQYAVSPAEDYSRDEARYGSAKLWGGAAVAALALGSLLYFNWPNETSQLPGTERAAQLPPGVQQVNSGAPTTGQLAKLPPAAEADGVFGEVKPWGPSDTAPVPEGTGESVDTAAATETAVPPAPAPAEVADANETQAQAGTEAGAGAEVASATPPAPAPVSSGQTSTETEVAAVAVPPPAPPPAQASPAAPPSMAEQPGATSIRTPAQWLGGGPTHQDNRGGRHVGSVVVQFTVQADGRVSNCGAVRSSGNAGLDGFTCRLVEQRMRFKPALNAQGNPVASTAHARYNWGRRRRPGLLSSIFR